MKVVSLVATMINRVLAAGIDGFLFLSKKRKNQQEHNLWTTDQQSIDEYTLERCLKIRTYEYTVLMVVEKLVQKLVLLDNKK